MIGHHFRGNRCSSHLQYRAITLHLNYFKCPKLNTNCEGTEECQSLTNTGHAGKGTENKYDFKREQKTGKVVADVTSVGRLFYKRLPATGKARSPTVTSLVAGTRVYIYFTLFTAYFPQYYHCPIDVQISNPKPRF